MISSRRRHTRVALVTGVQTCALPISPNNMGPYWSNALNQRHINGPTIQPRAPFLASNHPFLRDLMALFTSLGEIGERSEERRVGNECVSTCRSRWSPDNKKKQ